MERLERLGAGEQIDIEQRHQTEQRRSDGSDNEDPEHQKHEAVNPA